MSYIPLRSAVIYSTYTDRHFVKDVYLHCYACKFLIETRYYKSLSLYSFECKHFDLSEPEFPVADELRSDIERYESNWILFEKFSNGLDNLAKEDWISFRLADMQWV